MGVSEAETSFVDKLEMF